MRSRFPTISVRFPPALVERIDAYWRAEMEREAGVRYVSRNEVIAKLVDAGLLTAANGQKE